MIDLDQCLVTQLYKQSPETLSICLRWQHLGTLEVLSAHTALIRTHVRWEKSGVLPILTQFLVQSSEPQTRGGYFLIHQGGGSPEDITRVSCNFTHF